jgi:hypothetical protein
MSQTKTYRGGSLDELLPKIRAELGPDALILRERQGVVGGIGGFFARRCVEIEAAPRAVLAADGGAGALPLPSVPARLATSAYASASSPDRPGVAAVTDEATLEQLVRELTFADLLARAGAPADDADAGEPPEPFVPLVPEPELELPTPVPRIDVVENRFPEEPDEIPGPDDEAAVRHSLRQAGFPDADADDLVRHAMIHARPFAPHAPLRDVVRGALAEALRTPLGWKTRRRVLVLAGTEGAGTSEVAAALCAGYARVGLSVGALGLDGVRAAVALATHTEDAAVAVAIAEDVDDVRRALPRLGRPDLLVAIAPTVVPGDEARRARTAEVLAELPAHDLHLVLPSGATGGDAQAAWAALAGAVRVKALLPAAFDEAATIGGAVALALREKLELRWTASGAGAVRLATAAPEDLASRVLP